MGQHKRASSFRNPNPVHAVSTEVPDLCLVCKGPSAMFIRDPNPPSAGAEFNVPYRVAKTMRRITADNNPDKVYVHEEPCLVSLVNNWAKYIVEQPGLKALAQREDESAKQSNP